MNTYRKLILLTSLRSSNKSDLNNGKSAIICQKWPVGHFLAKCCALIQPSGVLIIRGV